tara:strand:- start:139 stop:324 length:186 start_codon:yes stop_codon:yes gene_type:complete
VHLGIAAGERSPPWTEREILQASLNSRLTWEVRAHKDDPRVDFTREKFQKDFRSGMKADTA